MKTLVKKLIQLHKNGRSIFYSPFESIFMAARFHPLFQSQRFIENLMKSG